MTRYSVPRVDGRPSGGLADTVYEIAERSPVLALLSRRQEPDGDWDDVPAAEFRDEVLALAKGLLARGVRFGDRVAIMSTTRYEWTLFDYALWSVGAIPVPIYPTAAAEQARWILAETGAMACVVEHEDHAMTVGAVCDALPHLTGIWQLDQNCVAAIRHDGRDVPDEVVHRQRTMVTPDTVATVIYTSGTTGRPKGCLVTHGNFASEADALMADWPEVFQTRGGVQAATVLFLPLAHVYGRVAQVSALRGGVRIGHHGDLAADSLIPALASFRPTFLVAVPYLLEKFHQRAREAAEAAGHGSLFEQAAAVGTAWAAAREQRVLRHGAGPGPLLRMQHRMFDQLVYQRLREVFGGRIRYVVSGGSTLGRELGLFFEGAGMTVLEGYGLSETTAAVTANRPGHAKFGTVGRPLPGTTVAIAEDGEVLVSGPTVFNGYLHHPRCTEEALSDGWLATGDLGTLDDDGCLTITGRKKEMIVTSSGKTVAPAALEERVRVHPLVSQCVVVGDDRPYVAALLTLDQDALEHWLKLRGREQLDEEATLTDHELHQEIQRAVLAANTAVSRAESIRAFRLLPYEFTLENGLLTPSLKLRRQAIMERHADDIEKLYQA